MDLNNFTFWICNRKTSLSCFTSWSSKSSSSVSRSQVKSHSSDTAGHQTTEITSWVTLFRVEHHDLLKQLYWGIFSLPVLASTVPDQMYRERCKTPANRQVQNNQRCKNPVIMQTQNNQVPSSFPHPFLKASKHTALHVRPNRRGALPRSSFLTSQYISRSSGLLTISLQHIPTWNIKCTSEINMTELQCTALHLRRQLVKVVCYWRNRRCVCSPCLQKT